MPHWSYAWRPAPTPAVVGSAKWHRQCTALVEVYELDGNLIQPRFASPLGARPGRRRGADDGRLCRARWHEANCWCARSVPRSAASASTAPVSSPIRNSRFFDPAGRNVWREQRLGHGRQFRRPSSPCAKSVGAFALPKNSKDAETVVVLDPGAYTVQVSGADGGQRCRAGGSLRGQRRAVNVGVGI